MSRVSTAASPPPLEKAPLDDQIRVKTQPGFLDGVPVTLQALARVRLIGRARDMRNPVVPQRNQMFDRLAGPRPIVDAERMQAPAHEAAGNEDDRNLPAQALQHRIVEHAGSEDHRPGPRCRQGANFLRLLARAPDSSHAAQLPVQAPGGFVYPPFKLPQILAIEVLDQQTERSQGVPGASWVPATR